MACLQNRKQIMREMEIGLEGEFVRNPAMLSFTVFHASCQKKITTEEATRDTLTHKSVNHTACCHFLMFLSFANATELVPLKVHRMSEGKLERQIIHMILT